jgi:hypothetical protein
MDDVAGPDDEVVLTVQLELRLDRQPISGRLRTAQGADEQFIGWLGFVDALKKLQERGDVSAEPAETRPPGDGSPHSDTNRKERP